MCAQIAVFAGGGVVGGGGVVAGACAGCVADQSRRKLKYIFFKNLK